jgi:hypothetical protein
MSSRLMIGHSLWQCSLSISVDGLAPTARALFGGRPLTRSRFVFLSRRKVSSAAICMAAGVTRPRMPPETDPLMRDDDRGPALVELWCAIPKVVFSRTPDSPRRRWPRRQLRRSRPTDEDVSIGRELAWWLCYEAGIAPLNLADCFGMTGRTVCRGVERARAESGLGLGVIQCGRMMGASWRPRPARQADPCSVRGTQNTIRDRDVGLPRSDRPRRLTGRRRIFSSLDSRGADADGRTRRRRPQGQRSAGARCWV